MHFHVSHIFREGNRVADMLASRAVSFVPATWWSSAPEFVVELISRDILGVCNFRLC